jgi:hypothetical protein
VWTRSSTSGFTAPGAAVYVRSSYDAAKKVVELSVKQTREGSGPCIVPRSYRGGHHHGRRSEKFPIEVSQADQTFGFPVDGPPSLVLFDGEQDSEVALFEKTPPNGFASCRARDVPDRADAAQALGVIINNDAVVAALGEAARGDGFWGVRNEALRALGYIRFRRGRDQVLAALSEPSTLGRAGCR